MEKKKSTSLFVNDGSFMERFKQLQQETALEDSKLGPTVSGSSTPKPVIYKTSSDIKANGSQNSIPVASSGKLVFSLKQKSKLVAPAVKLGEDEDDDEIEVGDVSGNGHPKRQKLDWPDVITQQLNKLTLLIA